MFKNGTFVNGKSKYLAEYLTAPLADNKSVRAVCLVIFNKPKQKEIPLPGLSPQLELPVDIPDTPMASAMVAAMEKALEGTPGLLVKTKSQEDDE